MLLIYIKRTSKIFRRLSILILIGMMCSHPTAALASDQAELSDLKKVVSVQQALIGRLTSDMTDLKKQVATQQQELAALKNDTKANDIRISRVLNGEERFGQITFGNGSRIVQDNGISIRPQHNGQQSDAYYHFFNAIDAWDSASGTRGIPIWAWPSP